MSEPLRITIGAIVGVAAAAGLLGALYAVAGKGQGGTTGPPVVTGLVLAGAVAGFSAYLVTNQSESLPKAMVVDRIEAPVERERPFYPGVVSWSGSPGIPLDTDLLALTLDEAQALADGNLKFDAASVSWSNGAAEHLSSLPACKRARDAFDSAVWSIPSTALVAKIRQDSLACEADGWRFAESILAELNRPDAPLYLLVR